MIKVGNAYAIVFIGVIDLIGIVFFRPQSKESPQGLASLELKPQIDNVILAILIVCCVSLYPIIAWYDLVINRILQACS